MPIYQSYNDKTVWTDGICIETPHVLLDECTEICLSECDNTFELIRGYPAKRVLSDMRKHGG